MVLSHAREMGNQNGFQIEAAGRINMKSPQAHTSKEDLQNLQEKSSENTKETIWK